MGCMRGCAEAGGELDRRDVLRKQTLHFGASVGAADDADHSRSTGTVVAILNVPKLAFPTVDRHHLATAGEAPETAAQNSLHGDSHTRWVASELDLAARMWERW